MIYLVIILLLLFLIYKYDYCQEKKDRLLWYYIVLVIFIFVAGLRYRLGVDSIRYESNYPSLPSLSELANYDFSSSRFAPGYIVFAAIARSFSSEFVALQLIHAIFVNCVIFWFIKKYTSRIFFAVALYFVMLYINFMCEVMREACAVSAFLLGFPYFVKKKWVKYYIFAFFSFSFHPSAFVTFALPLLTLPGIRSFFTIGKRTIFILIGAYIVGVIINVAFFDYINLIEIASVQESAAMYANDSLAGQVLNINGIISTAILYLIYPILAVMFIRRRKNYEYADTPTFRAIELMVSICLIAAVFSIPIALFYRYNNYFYPFAIIAMSNFVFQPIIINRRRIRIRYVAWLLIFFPLFLFKFYGFYRPIPGSSNLRDGMRYYPYSSVINKDKDGDREKVYIFYHAY